MRCLLVLVLVIGAAAQTIPGIGTDPLKKGPVPMSGKQIDPPGTSPADIHQKTLTELTQLIEQATALEKELKEAGPQEVSAESAKRVAKMQKLLKHIEAGLKAK
jgi:hypothetical protein